MTSRDTFSATSHKYGGKLYIGRARNDPATRYEERKVRGARTTKHERKEKYRWKEIVLYGRPNRSKYSTGFISVTSTVDTIHENRIIATY